MRDLKLERECEKFSILCLCKNNHTCIYTCNKWDSDKALEILEMLKYCDASNNKGARKKFFITTFENFQNIVYTVYTAIPK